MVCPSVGWAVFYAHTGTLDFCLNEEMFVRPEKGCVGELIDVELIEDKVDINDDISALLACAA